MNHQQLPAPDAFHVQAGTEAVSRARRRISGTARHWNVPLSDSALADVELCASEIIANALTHAGRECWVRTHWTGQFLQVEVTDRSLRPPVVRSATSEATSGRGLALVESFSHGWGWVPRGLGKTVFFIVADEAVLAGAHGTGALARTARAHVQQNGSLASSMRGRGKRRWPTWAGRRLSCLGWS
ncbi:ATP-binding protein [Actinacidiphila sp. bgisy145]|uniref:ATP-binding protein n=1 Tax=Actinacidiphila sp. bgisy145 TaxID=3413792 RepID=UPI003EBF2C07